MVTHGQIPHSKVRNKGALLGYLDLGYRTPVYTGQRKSKKEGVGEG